MFNINEVISSAPDNIYHLPMGRKYVRHWKLAEAIRELLQNALDNNSTELLYDFDSDGNFSITSKNIVLDPSTLVLGTTSKADDKEKIGSFGEGYKLALLVLAREGYNVHVLNGPNIWVPTFEHSELFGTEVLAIQSFAYDASNTDLTFTVGGLSEEDVWAIKASCLLMQEEPEEVVSTAYGTILPDRKGQLFVNSLFVCKTTLDNSYNLKPDYISLERDRQTVSDFDLKWRVKDMWFSTKQYEKIAVMIDEQSPDLEYAKHGCPELLKEACYQLFMQKNPGGVIAKSPEHLKELVARGMTEVVYHSEQLYDIVSTSKGYSQTAELTRKPTPHEELQTWYDDNKKYLSRLPKVKFKDLLESAKNWKNI